MTCLNVLRRLSSAGSVFTHREKLVLPPTAAPVPIAWRKWLVGSTLPGNKLPSVLAAPKVNHPAVYEVKDHFLADTDLPLNLSSVAREVRNILDEKLHVYGCILFRGIPIKDVSRLSSFVKALGYKRRSYEAGVVSRDDVTDGVMTATDSDPPLFSIEPHNEMAYLEKFPSKAFRTNERNDVETFLEKNNHGYQWEEDGTLMHWRTLPAFRNHPITGERLWFNQITIHHASYFLDHPGPEPANQPNKMYPFHTSYGDGTEIEDEVIQHIRDVHWGSTVGFQMQKDDFLVMDNMLSMHSRIGFNCERRLLVALTDD